MIQNGKGLMTQNKIGANPVGNANQITKKKQNSIRPGMNTLWNVGEIPGLQKPHTKGGDSKNGGSKG